MMKLLRCGFITSKITELNILIRKAMIVTIKLRQKFLKNPMLNMDRKDKDLKLKKSIKNLIRRMKCLKDKRMIV